VFFFFYLRPKKKRERKRERERERGREGKKEARGNSLLTIVFIQSKDSANKIRVK